MRRLIGLLGIVVVVALLGGTPVTAQEGAGLTLTAQAGYDGYFKDGNWVPVHVSVANTGAPIDGELRIVTGRAAEERVAYAYPIDLPTQSNKRVTLYVYIPSFSSTLNVVLVDEDGDEVGAVAADVQRIDADDLLYGVVADEPVALDFLENVTGVRADAKVAYVDVRQLPDAGAAWNTLDVLIFSAVDSGRLTPAQQEALRGWVALGGQLVVTGGAGWQQTTAAFDELLPVAASGSRTVEDLPSLRTQMGAEFRDPGPYLVTESNLRAGTLLLHEDGLPLLARENVGRGNVYFLALDPNAAPLLDWSGSEALWTMIADEAVTVPVWAEGPRNSYDAGRALRSLSALSLPSTVWLFLFILFYVLVVGPLNYFVLRRLGRREWAWLSIPGLVIFFSLLAYLTGFRLRGNEVIANQMAIVYGHLDGDQMRVNTLLGLYSPARRTYDVVLEPDVLIRPFNSNQGGMAGSGNLQAVSRGQDTVLRRVRVDVSDMETFVASSYRPLPAIEGQATLHLDERGGELEIQIQNNSDLTLENAGLLFGSLFSTLGDLEPGATRDYTHRLSTRQARAAATGRSMAVGGAPLNAHYNDLLGTTNYYNDPEVFPRFQLLESMNYYGGPAPGPTSQQTSILLMGWSERPYLDVNVAQATPQQIATTFYILELPITEFRASGTGIEVPLEMMSWQTLNESNVYVPSISGGFHLPFGWVELEYEPWPLFQNMEVNDLALVLTADGTTSQTPPDVSLWDWEAETWVEIPNVIWGQMNIGDFAPYLGVNNTVRVRLQNDASGVNIRAIYPSLSGNIE